jgi:hypothetical protein
MGEQDRIVLRIDRETPIALEQLTLGMMAVAAEYERYVRREHPAAQDQEFDLLVEHVSEGSIVIELIGALAPVLQGMNNILIFKGFVEMIAGAIGTLTRPRGRVEEQTTTKELRDLARIAETVAGDNNGQIQMAAIEYDAKDGQRKVRARVVLHGRDAERVIENTEAQIKEITGEAPNRHARVLMTLYQTNKGEANPDRASGEKGTIESISEQPRRLIYASELAGQKIKSSWTSAGGNPYELGFVVDVDVQMVRGKPRAYRIMDVHDIFPLDDE